MTSFYGLVASIITNPSTSAAIQIIQTGNAAASTSVGGALNINNTGSTGAGLVVYSAQASPSGRLGVFNANHATFSQTCLYTTTAGTGHALAANNSATNNATGSAGNFTSSNVGASCLQVSGSETGRGSIKVTHTGTGTDGNASAISVDCAGTGTAAQGIFVDATGGGTTGALLNLRNNGSQILKVYTDATFAIPTVQLGNGGPLITTGAGTPESAVTAPVGSLYLNTSGGTSTTLYVKTSGTGNTGWTAK
jgi:Hyaluronidase protein (HylP)